MVTVSYQDKKDLSDFQKLGWDSTYFCKTQHPQHPNRSPGFLDGSQGWKCMFPHRESSIFAMSPAARSQAVSQGFPILHTLSLSKPSHPLV